jgi:uncharacterized protein YneF (UPF0154 family)
MNETNKNMKLKEYVNHRLGNLYIWEDGLFSRSVRYLSIFVSDIFVLFLINGTGAGAKLATIDIGLQCYLIGGLALGFLIAESYVQNKYKSTKDSRWMLLTNSIFILYIGLSALHLSECFLFRVSLPAYYYYGEAFVFVLCLFLTHYIQIYRIRKGEYGKLLYIPMSIGIASSFGGFFGYYFANKYVANFGKEGLLVTMSVTFLISSLMLAWHTGGFLKFYYARKYDIEVKGRVR